MEQISNARRWSRAGLVCAFLIAGSFSVLAQGMMSSSHGYLSGPLQDISQFSVNVQGVGAGFAADAAFIGMDSDGNLLQLSWSDYQLGAPAAVFLEKDNGVLTAEALYRGQLFMMQGTVTAIQDDGQGNPKVLTLDDTFGVNVSKAVFDGMDPNDMNGGMGGDMSGGMMGGGMGGGMMGNGGSALVQVGSTVALGGIADSGTFGAVFVHVMASSMMGNGTIQSLMHDMMGNVTGFSMMRSGQTTQVAMDASTRITKKGQSMPANSLQANMRVKVQGLSRQDGSLLATAVMVKGNGSGMH